MMEGGPEQFNNNENIESEAREIERAELIDAMRLPERYESDPVEVDEKDRALTLKTFEEAEQSLREHHFEGFGIFPSADPDSNYFNQVWARDSAHAIGNFFARNNPDAAKDALATLLKHQREDGSIPSRVEKEYEAVKFIPGLRRFSKPIFNHLETKRKGRTERPVYEGQDFAGGEDTIPATIIAAGEFFASGPQGQEFVKEHFDELKKAVDYFRGKTNPEDHLAVMTRDNPDWADTIKRNGEMGTINVWWARALRQMEFMASQTGHKEDAEKYRKEYHEVRKSVMEKLYDKEGAYFRDREGSDRLDTVASVFGALYLLSPEEAVKMEETFKKRVLNPSGLKNFDPAYPKETTHWMHRMMGQWKYHNEYVWPWVTAQNIQVKVKIALQHPDTLIRKQYKEEAIRDLVGVARLFEEGGSAYEVFHPDRPEKGGSAFYRPPKNFMGSLVSYHSAYVQLKELGWI